MIVGDGAVDGFGRLARLGQQGGEAVRKSGAAVERRIMAEA